METVLESKEGLSLSENLDSDDKLQLHRCVEEVDNLQVTTTEDIQVQSSTKGALKTSKLKTSSLAPTYVLSA